jgi:hypothetical protein
MRFPSERLLFKEYIQDVSKRHPEWVPIISFTWWRGSKPPQIVPAKRQTGLCTYCLSFDFLLEDYMKHNYYRPLTIAEAEEAALVGSGEGPGGEVNDGPNDGDQVGTRRVPLHQDCDGLCCEWCRSGGCQGDKHPLCPETVLPESGGATKKTPVRGEDGAWRKLKHDTTCPEESKTEKCYGGTCDKCGGGKKGMIACPKETSGPGECKWRYHTYESIPKETPRPPQQAPPQRSRADDNSDSEDDVESEPKPKMRRVQKTKTKTGERKGYFAFFLRLLSTFMWHDYVNNNQYQECQRSSKEGLKPGYLWMQTDFAANLENRSRMETQSGWFSKLQTTILPIVVRYIDKGGTLREEYRVYVSDDLSHSHNFVKHCLEDCIIHYASLFESNGMAPLTHVMIWSDGCGSQFKNRWQLWWLVKMVATHMLRTLKGTIIKLVDVTHHFFASCHGKGPCDSCGARTKDKIHKAELGDMTFNSSSEHYEYLRDHATIEEGDSKGRNVCRYVWIANGSVDSERPDLIAVRGLKAMHMFRGKAGDKIQMNKLSCCCPTCMKGGDGNAEDPACRNHKQQRPPAVTRNMRTEANAAAATRSAARAAMDYAVSALEGSRAGDLVLIYVMREDRKVYIPEDHRRFEKAWNCRGRYRLAQLVEDINLDVIDTRRLVRPPKIKLFLPDEEEPENEYCFPSPDFCHGPNPNEKKPVPWNQCQGGGERTCHLKHYYEKDLCDVRLSLGPIEGRRGTSTDTTSHALRITLTEDEMEGIDDILDDLADTYPMEFGE